MPDFYDDIAVPSLNNIYIMLCTDEIKKFNVHSDVTVIAAYCIYIYKTLL